VAASGKGGSPELSLELGLESSPTRSTEGGGCHHGLCKCQRGRAWAGDEEADMRKDGEVRGGCGVRSASVPLPSTVVAAPLALWLVRWGRRVVRRCHGEWMGRNLLRWGKGSGWPTRSIL
jgi:hypothetical protein